MSDQANEAVAGEVTNTRGRPSDYSPELAEAICHALSEGQSLRSICLQPDMPGKSTVFRWLANNKDFRDQYARARESQADVIADEILNIADEAQDAAKARVQIDARKWLAGKLRPKVYGDKVSQEITGADGGPVQVTRIELVAPRDNSAD
jgi:hypothetical protein